jgi:site-specific DNA-methyltransferase (adenine-specific)
LGTADILVANWVVNGYPTEKPQSIVEILVRQSSTEGEIIADPFMGSGVVGAAAVKGVRVFWGNDSNAQAVTLAGCRIAKERGSSPGGTQDA